jgi:hypothetical protein
MVPAIKEVAMQAFQPLQEFRMPFSGDVTQAINPWTWTMRMIGGQFGLINVNLGSTPDPALEQAILDRVGSYGRQLGRIGDAMAVLLRHVDRGRLNAEELATIKALEDQLAQVNDVKRSPAAA